jgi:TolB-like protein/Tfp pilus assembly protein PilF/predicted Ser/Thr protein kinase
MNAGMISRYRLVRRLGLGGMGEVYLAQDTQLDRPVALKVMSQELARDENQRKRFRSEAKAASGLTHPNICVVHEVGETGEGRPFLAMEYVDGKTLECLLQERRLKIREALRIGIQVAAALDVAHARGIVHRDIKPGNIMLDQHGNAKVLDFGLAKRFGNENLTGSASSAAQTRTGMLIGTPYYMSPEQALGRELDRRTDIFSLGVVLFEILAGQRPFLGKTVGEIINNIVNQPAEPLGLENPLYSPTLDQIVGKCLEKDPDQRFQSAKTLSEELDHLRAEAERAAVRTPAATLNASSESTRFWQLPAKTAPGRWKAYAAGAVLVASVIVVAGLYPNRRGPARAQSPPAAHVDAARSPEKSVAVLPFVFIGEEGAEYLSDGLTEEITAKLSTISGLKVAARNSAYTFKGKTNDVRQIGETLRVRHILSGSVRKAGNRIRVTVELVNAAGAWVLWSDTYERSIDDLFAVQHDIAARIAEKLEASHGTLLAGRKPLDAETHRLYTLGRLQWNERTPAGLKAAASLFQQAIARDPLYSQAHAGLAATYYLFPIHIDLKKETPSPSGAEVYAKARAAARKALEIDPACSEAHAVLGAVQAATHDPKGAEQHFQRALELAPSNPTAHHWYGRFLNANGQAEEGLKHLLTAVELDPFSRVIRATIPEWEFLNGNYTRAVELGRKNVEEFPDFMLGRYLLAEAMLKEGLYEEALPQIKVVRQSQPSEPLMAKELEAFALARLGQTEEARKILAQFEERSGECKDPYSARAMIYTGLREFDKAIDCLEQGYTKEPMAEMILSNPFTEEFREDARFQALREKVLRQNKAVVKEKSRAERATKGS